MAERSSIEWTQATWNPWHGCRKVSPGCKNCYMFREKRQYGQEPTLVVRSKTTFRDPLKWKAPRRVFACSWSDFFIADADAWREEAWSVIRSTPQHTYLILTKRIENARGRLPGDWPLPNVWLGVSVEDQARADARVSQLLQRPASMRFVSIEPILGAVDLREIHWPRVGPDPWGRVSVHGEIATYDSLTGDFVQGRFGKSGGERLDWVIVGGESGPGARPIDVNLIRSIVGQCKDAGVPCFVKQLGANVRDRNDVGFDGDDSELLPHTWPSGSVDKIEHDPNGYREEYQGAPVRVHLSDRKGGDPLEWPMDLRIRDFPSPAVAGSNERSPVS